MSGTSAAKKQKTADNAALEEAAASPVEGKRARATTSKGRAAAVASKTKATTSAPCSRNSTRTAEKLAKPQDEG